MVKIKSMPLQSRGVEQLTEVTKFDGAIIFSSFICSFLKIKKTRSKFKEISKSFFTSYD